MRRSVVGIRLAILLAVAAVAQGSRAMAQTYTVMRLPPGASVAVDGDTSDLTGAPPITLTANATVEAYRLLWDEGALYIAADVQDAYLDAVETLRDGALWADDAFEIAFCTRNNRGAAELPNDDDYKFFVNILNVQHDARGGGAWGLWDAVWSSAASITGTPNDDADLDTGYALEARIAWADWGLGPPAPGETWAMDVRLNDRSALAVAHADWVNSDGGTSNDPDGWGTLRFTQCSPGAVECPAADECHGDGVCDSAAGTCTYPTLGDGSPCAGGTGICRGGACEAYAQTVSLVGWSCSAAKGVKGRRTALPGTVALLFVGIALWSSSRGRGGRGRLAGCRRD